MVVGAMKKYEASLRAARAVFPNQPPDDEKDDGGKERVTAKKQHHHVEDRIAQRLVDEAKQTDIERLQPVHRRECNGRRGVEN